MKKVIVALLFAAAAVPASAFLNVKIIVHRHSAASICAFLAVRFVRRLYSCFLFVNATL